MKRSPGSSISVSQRYAAPPAKVFDAWLDPARAGRFLFATATRPSAPVEIDARAGGAFRFERLAGRYVEIVRPERLRFTLGRSRVRVEFAPRGRGCELTLTHENLPADEAEETENRWAGMLYGLASLLD